MAADIVDSIKRKRFRVSLKNLLTILQIALRVAVLKGAAGPNSFVGCCKMEGQSMELVADVQFLGRRCYNIDGLKQLLCLFFCLSPALCIVAK